jgi:carbon-monoxide dehydrogenase small subunit
MSNESHSESLEKQEESKKAKSRKGISRREFIAGTVSGVVVGAVAGAAVGSLGFPRTVNQTETATQTKTATQVQTQTATQTTTATQTQTQTTTQTATSTVVQAPPAQYVNLTVNGLPVRLQVGVDVQPWNTLLGTLREKLGLTGTKPGCDMGSCGRCTVLANGTPVLACSTLLMDVDSQSITTIEGLQDPTTGKLHPIQQGFVNTSGSLQCGYCTPAMILTAKALLDKKPKATEADIVDALSGVICRCGSYKYISDSVILAESLK